MLQLFYHINIQNSDKFITQKFFLFRITSNMISQIYNC